MQDDDLNRIEAALGIHLPAEYRGTMQQYSFAPDSYTAEFLLVDEPTQIIAMNQGSDAQVLLQAQPEHGDRPAQFFQIGSDGGEERYYLDLSQTSSPIYSCDLETWTLTQRAEDIQAWIAECQAREEEIQQDELALRRKHWWQFWR